ncbi:MAG: ribosome silencing factor [Rubrivivax sp.]|nr:ribosome silencing factor [Rubrivivax sp.]
MDIRKLQRAIVDGLEDVKAQHIAVFNTEHLSSMFERVIVCSGTSNRQTKALAASVRDAVRSRGLPILSTEGEDNGEWIIVDCGAAVVHIMQPAIREYYHLEEIWGGKAVKMKLGEVNTRLVKASEPEPAPRKKPKAAAPAGDAPARTSAPRAPGSRAVARAEKRTNAKEVAEKKSTNRTAAFKRVAAKAAPRKAAPAGAAKAPAKKSTTKTIVVKPPAKKVVAGKAPAKKTAAGKGPVRKTAGKSPAKKATRKA